MKKLEKQPYKIVQYKDGFSGDWGLGFSLMNLEENYGYEYDPIQKRIASRDEYYPLKYNIERGTLFFLTDLKMKIRYTTP